MIVQEKNCKCSQGKDANDSPMYIKILDAFGDLKKQQDALRTSVDALKMMIRDLEDKPKDSSYDEEIKDLKREESALLTVLQEIGKKNIFNFLSDEGLLPNYAFPEAGIILRAVLYRKEDEETPVQKKNMRKWFMNIAVVPLPPSVNLLLITAFMSMVAS